ncbi:unnamed protein product [Cuscuta epithymum]|uniref:Pentatricopeptide repeat-containing protein n=2 Tax=Cuscuta epithymum TaxID=186058 RepID=A0AAV0F263_9ASTE|nr:unnamed protein product [Cuscuta epithymum]
MATSSSPSFLSSLLPSPLPDASTPPVRIATIRHQLLFVRCAVTADASHSAVASPKKRHWKKGEFPGTTEPSVLKNKRTPRKNIKKKLTRDNTVKPWASTVTEALSDCIEKKQWFQAVQVFEMLREQKFYQPKEGSYMRLLVLLGKCGQPSQAQKLFNTMIEEGLEPTTELYTALLAAYSRSNLIEKALAVLHEMTKLPLCAPDVHTYSILIKACVDGSRFDLLEPLYQEMDERSISPNTVTQNIVLSGYGKAGKYEEMEKVLLNMLESDSCTPDVWTMNTILSLFGNKGQIETMEKWYEKFRDFGIEPETRTFNILIGCYGKKKMYDKMSTVMEYMRRLSFPWTTSTYNNVIEAFSDVGDATHMEYTFDQMRGEGMKTDTKTFCCLIRGYANAGLFHKVISTVQLAGKLEIPENTSFFNALIYACAKADDIMEMERVFQRMKEKQWKPDSLTYSVMIDTYRKEGMTDKAYELEQETKMVADDSCYFADDNNNEAESVVSVQRTPFSPILEDSHNML